MSVSRPEGQPLGDQDTTGPNIDFSCVRNNLDLADALKELIQELARAREAGLIEAATEDEAQSYLTQAVRESNMPVPNKTTLLDHLDSARESLAGTPAAGGLINLVAQASEAVQARF